MNTHNVINGSFLAVELEGRSEPYRVSVTDGGYVEFFMDASAPPTATVTYPGDALVAVWPNGAGRDIYRVFVNADGLIDFGLIAVDEVASDGSWVPSFEAYDGFVKVTR